MKNKKSLIKDILTYIKENDEARERFIKLFEPVESIIINDYLKYKFNEFAEKMTSCKFMFSKSSNNEAKLMFILKSLSSPNGKPICGFLETEETIYNPYLNHASTLFNILTSQIEQGKSFDDAYKVVNEEYNKLI